MRLAIAAELPFFAQIVENPTVVLNQEFVVAYDRQALQLVAIAGELVNLDRPGSSRLHAIQEVATAIDHKMRRAVALIRGSFQEADERLMLEGFELLNEIDRNLGAWEELHLKVCSV